jgi:hypothetical protein
MSSYLLHLPLNIAWGSATTENISAALHGCGGEGAIAHAALWVAAAD